MSDTKQKLDNFNKIILATGTVNYLASAINGVNEQMKLMPDPDGYHKEGIETRDCILRDCADGLYAIMERLADYMNDADCICSLDIRATREAFKIVSGEKDETED